MRPFSTDSRKRTLTPILPDPILHQFGEGHAVDMGEFITVRAA
jgi:hypothetical protein